MELHVGQVEEEESSVASNKDTVADTVIVEVIDPHVGQFVL